MPDFTPEQKRAYWKHQKEVLRKIISEYHECIYNPNKKLSKTTVIPNYPVPQNLNYTKTYKVDLYLEGKQRRLMLSWLDATTEMYNIAQRYIKSVVKEYYYNTNKNYEFLKSLDEYKKDILNFTKLRDNYMSEDKERIRLKSNLRFYEKDFVYIITKERNDRKDSNLIYTHVLDNAIKRCCADCNSMITNYEKGNIKEFSFNQLVNDRRYKILELDAEYFKEKKSKFHKYFSKIKAICNDKLFDLFSIEHSSIIRYDILSDKFQLLVPIVKQVKNRDIKHNVISIDPGVRVPLTCVDDSSVREIGKYLSDEIRNKLTYLDKVQNNENIKGKIKKKHKKRTKVKIKNIVDDFHWRIANDLTLDYKIVLIGDINTKSIISNERDMNKLNKRIINALSLRKLIDRLRYKCQSRNVTFKRVNEAFTSKICSECGWCNENLGDSKTFKCEIKSCSNLMDRDVNAARNIMMKSYDGKSVKD